MTQKQTFGVMIGVAAIVLVCSIVYRQFGESVPEKGTPGNPIMKQETGSSSAAVPVPESIDGIAESIVSQSDDDAAAFDEEETGALEELETDSDSVNNLGTSYDANSL